MLSSPVSALLTLLFATLIPLLTPTSTQADTSDESCEAILSDQELVSFSLNMRLEKKKIPMRVPKIYFEDAWDRVDGAEHDAQLFSLDYETLTPITRWQQSKLNAAGQLNLLSILLRDSVGFGDLLNNTLDASQGWQGVPNVTENDFVQYNFDLVRLNIEGPNRDYVFLSSEDSLSGYPIIQCTGNRPHRIRNCQHFYRSDAGMDVKMVYKMENLSSWKNLQKDIESLITCFTEPIK